MHETDSWQMIFSSAFFIISSSMHYIVDVIGLIIVEHKNGVTILMHLTWGASLETEPLHHIGILPRQSVSIAI